MLPITFDLAKFPTNETIRLLASLLERMTAANDLLNKQQVTGYTRFHARVAPSIDIYSYLARILKYCPCANECFLSLLVYFDRMSKNAYALTGRPFTIDSFNIHRLIIAGVMVSSKFFSDIFYTNTRYAKVGGLPVTELNSLEIEFLKLNGYNLTVPISELQKYGDQLLKVNYIEMHSKQSFRHSRSNSFDQPPRNNSNEIDRVVDLTQRISLDDATYRPHLNKRNSNHSIRTRVSTNQLNKENVQDPRQTRSTVNLQGFWKPNNTTSSPQENNRRLSLSSVHVPPFIPSSEAVGYYYYPVTIGIPTPPPSASPVHHQQPYHMYL